MYAVSKNKDISVAVVGASGYAGLELVRLLLKHPRAEIKACFSTQSPFSLSDYVPAYAAKSVPVIPIAELPEWARHLDTVFLASPVEASLDLAPKLLELGCHVIDLSGAFRLKAKTPEAIEQAYEQWYGLKHPAAKLVQLAEYGLVPWVGAPEERKEPTLVSNPGCYATSILMALLPLLKRNLVVSDSLVIDAKSGTSGAGKKASERLLFTEVDGECLPYRIGKHQHLPEIQTFSQIIGGVAIDPMFTTHLLGVRRGIISGIYGKLQKGVTQADIDAAYANDYSDYELLEWSPLDASDTRSNAFNLSLKRIVGSAFTRLHYQVCGDKLYLFSVIDNLVKGAAGQAIENFNRLHALPYGEGLMELEAVL